MHLNDKYRYVGKPEMIALGRAYLTVFSIGQCFDQTDDEICFQFACREFGGKTIGYCEMREREIYGMLQRPKPLRPIAAQRAAKYL